MCNKIYKEVLRLVSEVTEIPIPLIQSKSRLEDAVSARQMVAYFCLRAGLSPRQIADKIGISRQAVCQKIATITDKRRLKSFDFNFKRIEAEFSKIFDGASTSQITCK